MISFQFLIYGPSKHIFECDMIVIDSYIFLNIDNEHIYFYYLECERAGVYLLEITR